MLVPEVDMKGFLVTVVVGVVMVGSASDGEMVMAAGASVVDGQSPVMGETEGETFGGGMGGSGDAGGVWSFARWGFSLGSWGTGIGSVVDILFFAESYFVDVIGDDIDVIERG